MGVRRVRSACGAGFALRPPLSRAGVAAAGVPLLLRGEWRCAAPPVASAFALGAPSGAAVDASARRERPRFEGRAASWCDAAWSGDASRLGCLGGEESAASRLRREAAAGRVAACGVALPPGAAVGRDEI